MVRLAALVLFASGCGAAFRVVHHGPAVSPVPEESATERQRRSGEHGRILWSVAQCWRAVGLRDASDDALARAETCFRELIRITERGPHRVAVPHELIFYAPHELQALASERARLGPRHPH